MTPRSNGPDLLAIAVNNQMIVIPELECYSLKHRPGQVIPFPKPITKESVKSVIDGYFAPLRGKEGKNPLSDKDRGHSHTIIS